MHCWKCDVAWMGKDPCWSCGKVGIYGSPPRPQTYAILGASDYTGDNLIDWSN